MLTAKKRILVQLIVKKQILSLLVARKQILVELIAKEQILAETQCQGAYALHFDGLVHTTLKLAGRITQDTECKHYNSKVR